jgi:nucleoside-diphosphate-sugar epimerase
VAEALLTGAGGFIGRALARVLPGSATLRLGVSDWEARLAAAPLAGAVIFHLAARVHAPDDRDEAAFHRDNTEKTRRLAEEAARRGARRLVFLSSIKAQAEESRARALRPEDPAEPADAYGRSKLAAERALATAGLPVVVVRAPLVFGAGAKGNLRSLMALADSGWPLPFAGIDNRRSFVHVEDLARLLAACGEHAAAPGRTFIAAHPVPWSTPRLVSCLRRELGRPERLFALPPALLESAAALVGQGGRVRPLTRSLECDPGETERTLGWSARIGLEEATREMARTRRGTAI